MSSAYPKHAAGTSAKSFTPASMMKMTTCVLMSISLYFVFVASPSTHQRVLNAYAPYYEPSDRYHMHRAPPALNYTGASTFVSYFVAALVLTFTILRMTYSRAQASLTNMPETRYDTVKGLTFCALVSFVVLSGNMLGFLIKSYQAWASAIDTQPLRVDGLLGNIWQWMTTSSLFLDFAKSLCTSPGGFWWSRIALYATMFSYMILGCLEQAYQTRRAWVFIMLAQILPVSFSLNLFFIYLLVGPEMMRRRAEPKIESEPKSRIRRTMKLAGFLLMQCFLCLQYYTRLNQLSESSNDETFLKDVLVTRLLLLAAYLIPAPEPWAVHVTLLRSFPVLLLGLCHSVGFSELRGWALLKIFQVSYWTIGYNRAVETMRFDLFIWLLSMILWAEAVIGARPHVRQFSIDEKRVGAKEDVPVSAGTSEGSASG